MARITTLNAFDIRFPTSRLFDGSDAMNPDPDYSAAYVVLGTDDPSHPRRPVSRAGGTGIFCANA
jgi:L-fuconate dehydratase